MRKILIGFGVLIALAVAVVAGVIYHERHIRPDYDQTVKTAAVRAGIEVDFDSAGVPHIWARNEEDVYFAQGYVQAQERLWQLELFRRVAEGRLSEVLGASLVDTDKFLRTIGLWQAAGLNESVLTSDQRHLLESFAAGVNFWIEHHSGSLPPEFTLLRIRPERWTVRHSLAIEKIMAMDLAELEGSIARTQRAHAVGAERTKYLEVSDPSWGLTIIESLTTSHASNGWVIGGTRTKSGKPILANDMHLALRQPGVWYLMALHAPGLDVAGMSLPGTPGIVAGHNKAVAWGFTNVMLDDVDLYEEKTDPSDSTRYLTPAGSEPFTLRSETMRVKGKDQPISFTVRSTRHGPVLSDVDKRLKGLGIISMQWAALDTSHALNAVYRFNHARNAQEFLAAVPYFDNPHQNVVYADTAGRFGYQMGGRIPLRGARRKPPTLPVPGWTDEYDWKGYLLYEEKPSAPDPANGYAVTANNRQVRSEVGDLIGTGWDMPYRAMRIREMILAQPKHDAASVHQMQLDVKDLLAVRYAPKAIAAAHAAGLKEAESLLRSWDGRAERDSKAAAYFYVWYESLRRSLAGTLFGKASLNIPRDAFNAVLDSGRILWSNGNLDSLSRVAMLKADSIAHGKTWGDLHRVLIVHAIGEVKAVQTLLGLNVGPEPHRGSPTTVDVAQYVVNGYPITTSYGPSERHVVDMSNVDGEGGFILPSGQSGLPGSDHYADMFARWRHGGLWRIPLDRKAAESRTVHRMIIRPE